MSLEVLSHLSIDLHMLQDKYICSTSLSEIHYFKGYIIYFLILFLFFFIFKYLFLFYTIRHKYTYI